MGRKKKSKPVVDYAVASGFCGTVETEWCTQSCDDDPNNFSCTRQQSFYNSFSVNSVQLPTLHLKSLDDDVEQSSEIEPIFRRPGSLKIFGAIKDEENIGFEISGDVGSADEAGRPVTIELEDKFCDMRMPVDTSINLEPDRVDSTVGDELEHAQWSSYSAPSLLLSENLLVDSEQALLTKLEELAEVQKSRTVNADRPLAVAVRLCKAGYDVKSASSWRTVSQKDSDSSLGTIHLDLHNNDLSFGQSNVMQSHAVMLRYGSSRSEDSGSCLNSDNLKDEHVVNQPANKHGCLGLSKRAPFPGISECGMSRAVDSMLASVNKLIGDSQCAMDCLVTETANDVPLTLVNDCDAKAFQACAPESSLYANQGCESDESGGAEEEMQFAKDLIQEVIENAKQALMDDMHLVSKPSRKWASGDGNEATVEVFGKDSLSCRQDCSSNSIDIFAPGMRVSGGHDDAIFEEEKIGSERSTHGTVMKPSAVENVFDSVFCDSFIFSDVPEVKDANAGVRKKDPARILKCSPLKAQYRSVLPKTFEQVKESDRHVVANDEGDQFSPCLPVRERNGLEKKESGIDCDYPISDRDSFNRSSEKLVESLKDVCSSDSMCYATNRNGMVSRSSSAAYIERGGACSSSSATSSESGIMDEDFHSLGSTAVLKKTCRNYTRLSKAVSGEDVENGKCVNSSYLDGRLKHLLKGGYFMNGAPVAMDALSRHKSGSNGDLEVATSVSSGSGPQEDKVEESWTARKADFFRETSAGENRVLESSALGSSLQSMSSDSATSVPASLNKSDTSECATLSKVRKKKKKPAKSLPLASQNVESLSSQEIKPFSVRGSQSSKLDLANGALLDILIHDIASIEEGFVLFDKDASFESACASMSGTGKQLLALQIALDCPGMVKCPGVDGKSSVVDSNASDVFVGLISLFVLLLQGNIYEAASLVLYVPFDVVSLQQVFLDGQLVLLVGVAENQNTFKLKSRKSKANKTFFQVVTHFLNVTTLEKVLADIWQATEERQVRERLRAFSNFWDQLHFQASVCVNMVPGSGKLSSYISINPDPHALGRILKMSPSLTPFVDESQVRLSLSESALWFHGRAVDAEYASVNVQNVLSMSLRNIAWLLLRLRDEAVEICGLRVGYVFDEEKGQQTELAMAIREVRACSIEEGRLLLSADSEEAGNLTINFLCEVIPCKESGEPILNYAVNSGLARRRLAAWFGPHFESITELESVVVDMKKQKAFGSSVKNGNCVEGQDLPSVHRMSFLAHVHSYGILLVAQLIPSSFLAIIISAAEKKGLLLRTLCKSSASASSLLALGVPESQALAFSSSRTEDTGDHGLGSPTSCSFTSLVFEGRSVSVRLLGLISRLTSILNSRLTAESIMDWLADKTFKCRKSHNYDSGDDVDPGSRGRKCLARHSKDYFIALGLNDKTSELVFSHRAVPGILSMQNVLYRLPQTNWLARRQPEICLAFIVLTGEKLINFFPSIFKSLFASYVFDCLSSWQTSAVSRRAAMCHEPLAELLGLKYLPKISEQMVKDVLEEPVFSSNLRNPKMSSVGKPALLVVARLQNSKIVADFRDQIEYGRKSVVEAGCSCDVFFHADSLQVFRLITTFFYSMELRGDVSTCRSQTWPLCLPHDYWLVREGHPNVDLSPVTVAKRPLPRMPWNELLPNEYLPVSDLYYEIHSVDLALPAELVLPQQPSYCGVSVLYEPEHESRIVQAISRILRFGFVMCALNFPVFGINGSCYMNLVMKRVGAIALLNKMLSDLEDDYAINIKVSHTVRDAIAFIREEFPAPGGIFHPTPAVLLHDIFFREEKMFGSNLHRDVVSDPKRSSVIDSGVADDKAMSIPVLPSPIKFDNPSVVEANVVLITSPLLRGKYLHTIYPLSCHLGSLWKAFVECGFRTIAAKTTAFRSDQASALLTALQVEGDCHRRWKKHLTHKHGPCIALVVLKSCALSNFWGSLEDYYSKTEGASQVLKKHVIVPRTRNQVKYLLLNLFEAVLPNEKIAIVQSSIEL